MTYPVQIRGAVPLGEREVDLDLADLATRALACNGDVDAALQLALDLSPIVPQPGCGATASLWSALATVAAADVTVARVVEPHLDALAILDQAVRSRGVVDLSPLLAGPMSTWGVFAAEAPHARLEATRDGDGWVLDGAKAWCSLAGVLTHALVSAHTGDSTRRLFAVALRQPGVRVATGEWHPSGLAAIPSGRVDFMGVEAIPIGEDDWYVSRAGFAWGGIGVAACWFGAAVGIARRTIEAARTREPDQISLMHLGAIDTALHSARVVLAESASLVDSPTTDREASTMSAHRTRNVVARGAEEIIARVGHALGPAPLALEPDHARRVADLTLYLRQHHAERDDAALGRRLLMQRSPQW